MLRGPSESKACLMLRRGELEKERLRWGTLFPETVCLFEEQDKTAGLWEARAAARYPERRDRGLS